MGSLTTRRVLMVAFHYPPCAFSSGIQRTLKFSRYLPEADWQPVVLTANRRAYPRAADEQLREIPASVVVTRTLALDASRHLAICGAYPAWLGRPDHWVSWWLSAVPAGLRLIRRHRPAVLWSTFPIATAHLIALTLHRLTRLPWVADFRDSMTEEDYPRDPVTRRTCLGIERAVVARASLLVFTAERTRQMYLDRYPALGRERCALIPNGYDEADFADLAVPPAPPPAHRPLGLLHAGLIYPEERDPRPLFRALARLTAEGRIPPGALEVKLRAAGSEDRYGACLRELGLHHVVRLLPPIPYREALRECLESDALLVLQGPSCDHQIPAKVYEYLRAHRPILALTTDRGDTAALLREVGGATIVDIGDENALYGTIPEFLSRVRDGTHALPAPDRARRYARQNQALELARHLDMLAPPVIPVST